jgi:ribonuclease E
MATKKMLIDSSHPEETRVVVATGTRLDEFDFETSTRKQLKGNIYLAKVTRVEPSLQAAFVEYGGNRHGFLPFGEIHPDYYHIPVSDRERLFAEQEAAEREEDEAEDEAAQAADTARRDAAPEPADTLGADEMELEPFPPAPEVVGEAAPGGLDEVSDWAEDAPPVTATPEAPPEPGEPAEWRAAEAGDPPQLSRPPFEVGGFDPADSGDMESAAPAPDYGAEPPAPGADAPAAADYATESFDGGFDEAADSGEPAALEPAMPAAEGEDLGDLSGPDEASATGAAASDDPGPSAAPANGNGEGNGVAESGSVEEVGGDEIDEQERRHLHVSRSLLSRRYKIQEVIRKRQIMLVQVVKEERGTKGAALTTYLSIAGRYCVLMPNAIRGGGISRKIVNAEDRRRLKAITGELELPPRMGVIVRTAGMNRTKAEIKRDFEYLLRQWESIRELTLRSSAPCLIYGEANLIRRSIRDLYAKDIDEILVEGDEGYRIAKDFMRTLIPSHTAKVQPYRDRVPLFVRYQVESQLDSMYSPQVQLRSGGYLVINQTEALVAIDVNSGRATRERNIEETAFRTNLEAADELARQLRLRDLAGLIVIDFIDMDEGRNQRAVERRLKEAMKSDRARIQVGRISAFGLLELSRQRLRPSLAEASMETCASCGGSGLLRSVESAALHVLRTIEEEGLRGRAAEIRVRLPTRTALYILNNKRAALADIEARYGFVAGFTEDNTLGPVGPQIERVRARSEVPAVESRTHEPVTAETTELPPLEEEDEAPFASEAAEETVAEAERPAAQPAESAESGGRRRRRRRRRGGEAAERREPAAGPAVAAARAEEAPAGGFADDDARDAEAEGAEPSEEEDGQVGDAGMMADGSPAGADDEAGKLGQRRRRRGRRGGRRRRGRNGGAQPELELQPEAGAGDASDALARPGQAADAAGEEAPSADHGRGRHRRRGRRVRAPAEAHEAPAPLPPATEPGMTAALPEPGAEAGSVVWSQPPSFSAGEAIIVPPAPPAEPFTPPAPDYADRVSRVAPDAVPEPQADASAPGPQTDQPEPGRDDSTSEVGPETIQPSGPPRRGWWQRVITGR